MATPFTTIPTALESLSAGDIVRWAADEYGADHLVVTASFEDAVMAHVAHSAVPGIEIVLLDTQYLFAETKWYAERLVDQFGFNLRVQRPAPEVQQDDLWLTDTEACCFVRKVEPLNRALDGKRGWITGVRRADGPSRAHTPVASYDIGRGLVKVNPLALWSDDDVALYEQLHELPRNPLSDKGYTSIGCWPCTRPVALGEDKRAGRWSGSAKTECGLHA